MWRDDAYILDMLIAARKVRTYVEDVDHEEFERNSIVQDAVMRQIEVLGEAARCVSDSEKSCHAEIPWRELVNVRNRLIHQYFRVDVDKLWDMITDDLPAIISQLERIVPPGK